MQIRELTPHEIAEKEVNMWIALKDFKPIKNPEMLVVWNTVRRVK